MPGGKTPLFIPLGAGIQTDIDDRLLPVGHALDVTNQYVKTNGNLAKRAGMLIRPNLIQPGGVSLPQTWQLAKYKGARMSLAATPANQVATFSPSQGAWDATPTDRRGAMTTSITKLPSTSVAAGAPKIASGAGYFFLHYNDTLGQRIDVIDAATRQLVKSFAYTLSFGSSTGYDIAFCNGIAVAAAADQGNGIVFKTLNPATMTLSTTTFADAAALGFSFDIMVKNATTVSVVYNLAAGTAAAVDFVPSTLAATGWSPRDSAGATIDITLDVKWVIDLGASGKQALATAGPIQGVRTQWDIPAAGALRQAATTYVCDPAATANVSQLAAHTIGSSATGDFQVLISISATPLTNGFTKMAIRTGGVLTGGFVLYRSLTLLSRAFANQGDFYALFCFPSDLDGNSYAMRLPITTTQPTLAAPQAMFGVGSTGGLNANGNLNARNIPQVVQLTSTSYITAITYLERIGKAADATYGTNTVGCELVDLNFIDPAVPSSTGTPIEALDAVIVPGSPIGHFDGVTYAEISAAYGPPQGTLASAGGGGLTANATYWYCFVFAWMDARGRLWRSAPSVPQSIAMGANTLVNGNAPTLRVTGRSNVFVEVYRAAANVIDFFQKVTQVANTLTADTVAFIDNFTDTQLAVGEALYTNGDPGALPNTTIPGSPFVFTFQNRLCFISADDPTQLWFSNQITPTNGVRFNEENVITIADERGGMYGAGTMDDKVVAFKQSAVYAFSGEGPDDTGAGSFSTPQIVALGLGCTQPRSIVSQKDGVVFESQGTRSGLQMINGGLSVATDKNGMPFGAAVQRYQNETIMSGVLIPEQSQMRWYCASGRVLVYDLVSAVWTTFLLNMQGATVVSALSVDGGALVATSAPAIWFEDTTFSTFTDNGQQQTVISATPWIQGTGPRGFERVSEFIGMGKTIGDHTLTTQLYFDFDENTIITSRVFPMTAAGTPKWNWEWVPRFQRCSAFKVQFVETSTGAGFESEGVTAKTGSKSGLARQSPTTRGA